MNSDTPHFNDPADDDDARWEAYLALQRRASPEGAAGSDEPDIEDEAIEPPYRPLGPLAGSEADPGRPTAAAPRRGRSLRLVAGATAVTAGIVLAAALVQRPPAEPAVIAWRPTATAAPVHAPPPPVAAAPLAPAVAAPPIAPAPQVIPAAAPTPRRHHVEIAAAHPSQVSANHHDALSCWLTVMNNGERAGYADAGLSVCPSAAPAKNRLDDPG